MRQRREIRDGFELLSDGRTVWVNTSVCAVGRFGPYGIDVHRTLQAQMEGQPECLACTHGLTNLDDWRRFQSLMQQHYSVTIPDHHMPASLRTNLPR